MPNTLDILIPHYHEEASVIKPLLDSIALQQAVDFDKIGVIICHDGSEPNINDSTILGDYNPGKTQSKEFDFYDDMGICGNYSIFADYPFGIKQIHIPHGGVSAARNAALDASEAEYVMFCDADDIFSSLCGLWIIFREMTFGAFDGLVSQFTEEIRKEDGTTVFVAHEKDCTFVHGKVWNRKYLIENEIRWNESLTIHEDSYFNILAQSFSENIKYCPIAFYLWKWRDDSICRHDNKYILKTYNNLIDSNEALLNEFQRRDRAHDAEFYVVSMVFDAYYIMNKPEWINQENVEYRDSTEKRFADYFRAYKSIWDGAKIENKMKVSNHVRAKYVREGMWMETMTIDQWLSRVEAL